MKSTALSQTDRSRWRESIASHDADGKNKEISTVKVRGLAVTAVHSLEWFEASPADAQARMLKSAGIDTERERGMLAAWRASKR